MYWTEILDLDAEVNGRYLDDSFDLIADLLGSAPRRIVDLGAGTGTGSVALARRFDDAEVVAVDSSSEMIDATRAAAVSAGVGQRVQGVRADVDHGWPTIEPVDLVWAASSMHHVADPAAAFDAAFAGIRPGGVVAVVEMDDQPMFLPAADGLAEVEERLHVAMGWRQGHDWAATIRGAGFTDLRVHALVTDLVPAPPRAVDYAEKFLRRVNSLVQQGNSGVSAEDAEALDILLGSLRERSELRFHSTRTLWLARRP